MRISVLLALAVALVALLAISPIALAVPCVPFPGSWTGDPSNSAPLSSWIGSAYDHDSGCDSPVMGATVSVQSTSNDSSIQIYIAMRTDSNMSVSDPLLVYDGEFSGDGTFHNVSLGSTEGVNDFTFQAGAHYLVIVKSATEIDEEIGIDDTNGYSMWQLTKSGLPGPSDTWTLTSDKKVRVWFHLMPSCDGILADQVGVCNGHGTCIGFDLCDCTSGYDGQFCNSTQGGSSASNPQSSSAEQQSSSPGMASENPGPFGLFLAVSVVGVAVLIVAILVVVVVVIVAVIAGVVYYNQHRYPLPRTYSRPFAEMPGKDTDFSPMAI